MRCHLSIPHAWLQLTLARPGAGLCGCGSSGRGGGGGGGGRRRWAGPAAIIAATCSAVTGTCSAVTAACPALAAACSAVTAACRDAGHACSGSRGGVRPALPRHPPARSPAHGIGLPTLRWPLRWQPDLLDFTLPPTPSVVTPVMTTSENWVAEMESEIREFDQLTAQHMPSSAPGAGWKQSMEEELELHLSKT